MHGLMELFEHTDVEIIRYPFSAFETALGSCTYLIIDGRGKEGRAQDPHLIDGNDISIRYHGELTNT